jgi:phosphoribosylglycinamide formyltransferase-1
VLLSGGGTTLQNLLDRCADGRLAAEVVQVVSSRADAFGLDRARRAGVPAATVSRKEAGSLEEFSSRVFEVCRQARAELVCLAGFLQLLHIPEDFHGRVMNIHPALIPAFCGAGYYGRRVHEAALAYGVKVSGCTVHFADNEYDHGPIILQRVVEVRDDDTPETLAARVHEQENEAYPEAIRLFAEGRLRVDRRRVRVRSRPGIIACTTEVPAGNTLNQVRSTMNVTYSDGVKERGERYELLQQATKGLEEVLGPAAASAKAEWDRTEDPKGRTLYTLRVSDWTGSAAASFAPEELTSATHMRVRLHHLWGDLLGARSRKQLQELMETNGAGE